MYNEANIINPDHFGAAIESDSLQRFPHRAGYALGPQLFEHFSSATIRKEAEARTDADPEERRTADALTTHIFGGGSSAEVIEAKQRGQQTRAARLERHYEELIRERLTVLETIVMSIHRMGDAAASPLEALVRDLRRAFAETRVSLDIRGNPPMLIPLDESLLQQEVIDPLLARLHAHWPDRARELVSVYHDVLESRNLDEVFSSAFKTLEEIARALTADKQFDFSSEQLKRHYPLLHPTITQTIIKLRAHRGDAAAHGRQGPNPREIRYLLFQVCNVALLLLDYEES